MKAEQILQNKGDDVYSVRDTDTVSEAIALLNEKNIGAVMVKNASGEVVGILSERDVVRKMGERPDTFVKSPVRGCMTPDPVTTTPEATLDDLMGLMTERRIRHLPVCEGKTLKGVVSIGDVVKRKIELAELEAKELKNYIAG